MQHDRHVSFTTLQEIFFRIVILDIAIEHNHYHDRRLFRRLPLIRNSPLAQTLFTPLGHLPYAPCFLPSLVGHVSLLPPFQPPAPSPDV
jgi:hypothetical protein